MRLRKISSIARAVSALLFVFVPVARSQELPQPVIVLPESEATLSQIAFVIVEQQNPQVSPFDISAVRFEFSTDQTNWNLIDESTGRLADNFGEQQSSWEILWDPSALCSGPYFLRAVMETFSNQIGVSEPIPIRVHKPPTAQVQVSSGSDDKVLLDGTLSAGPDGDITSWTWDFGDGETGSGATVEHLYSDLTRTYDISLTVQDDLSGVNAAYYELSFEQDQPVGQSQTTLVQSQKCICKSIQARSSGQAQGKWSAIKGWHDGKTLGPLSTNPGNTTNRIGFLWEIVAEVEGNPNCCRETQVARATTVWANMSRAECERRGGTYHPADDDHPVPTCTEGSPWAGTTADLNVDDVIDIDVSTAAKCAARGGRWDGAQCHLTFPQGEGLPYKPHSPGGKSKYDDPSHGLKVHQGTKILWLTTQVHIDGGNVGTTGKGDYIAIIRGTDGKYCYVKVGVDLERKGTRPHKEDFTSESPVTGADAVPGVP